MELHKMAGVKGEPRKKYEDEDAKLLALAELEAFGAGLVESDYGIVERCIEIERRRKQLNEGANFKVMQADICGFVGVEKVCNFNSYVHQKLVSDDDRVRPKYRRGNKIAKENKPSWKDMPIILFNHISDLGFHAYFSGGSMHKSPFKKGSKYYEVFGFGYDFAKTECERYGGNNESDS
jgi:hypothetical protein